MTIKIVSDDYGYHFDQSRPFSQQHHAIKMGFNQAGMEDPLGPYPYLYVTDATGNRLKLIGNKEMLLERVEDEARQYVNEFELIETNGVFFFLAEVDVTEPIKRKA